MRTVRHVPPRALAWRVMARARRMYFRLPLYGLTRLHATVEGTPAWIGVELISGDPVRGRGVAEGKFAFVGHVLDLGVPPRTWLPVQGSALWIFNLHYHEWLGDLRAAGQRDAAQKLIGDWMQVFGHYHPVVWHPYPTSLRLVAWLTHGGWLLEGADEAFIEAFYGLMRKQGDYLTPNCEWDLGGNHLLKNLKALIYHGMAWPDRRETATNALAELLRQVREQVLPDGGHYERSSLYQAQVLRDLLDVRAVLRKQGGTPGVLDEVVRRMGTALGFYCHADGRLGLWNDAAELDETLLGQLLRLSGAEEPPALLPDTGYARLQRGPLLLVMDGGKVGPDENPGHAHADTLSFELDVGRERVIVNCGTYAYQDKLRNTLRGTAAHSTVCLDGLDSAEVWGGFRVGRRPEQVSLNLAGPDGQMAAGMGDAVLEGSHDGYRHKGVLHRRKLVVAGDGSRMRGEDELVFRKPWKARVVGHFHLHPGVDVRLLSEREAELTLAGGRKLRFTVENGRLDVKDSRYAPQFGVLQPSRQLAVHGRPQGKVCRLEWQLQLV